MQQGSLFISEYILNEKPRDPLSGILNKSFIAKIIAQGALIAEINYLFLRQGFSQTGKASLPLQEACCWE